MYQHILYKSQQGIARITLNRPQVYHALNPELIREITQAVLVAHADETVRVVVITGAGDKAFCSGADLKEATESKKTASETLEEFYEPMIDAIREIPKPVICRLNGLAVGAGCSLALACDMIIASEESYLSLLFVQIGLMPDAGATFFLPRLVGAAKAFELATTGRKVSATEAAQIGLINKAVPAAELDGEIEKLTTYYQSAPTLAIGMIKKVLNQSFQSDLARMQEFERVNQDILFESQDAREGISSFLQKKKADFKGY
ncbi:enoyl-CoA hydratase/isomerase family protein [Dyadobacter arcticus]|uniref:2-(1,2-epoxy-1,2-dihydrophenyl)acetyl-CoA isomerase n=1 Tax=Dyadobacter arcticus TaxID=1078754 RepID=A0ABX0UTC7_9BACT|nr:enoyl-CoA hydratase-related protein [Dyadobacter arcticus]NIJ55484.1 2-(1,2-epoxy-1,2-dihydrophenyl)acetyl-CoA isomerase [Dyadobacter arcticus]